MNAIEKVVVAWRLGVPNHFKFNLEGCTAADKVRFRGCVAVAGLNKPDEGQARVAKSLPVP
jgi:hypothetical protein